MSGYAYKLTCGGLDWHDTTRHYEQLQLEGSYKIKKSRFMELVIRNLFTSDWVRTTPENKEALLQAILKGEHDFECSIFEYSESNELPYMDGIAWISFKIVDENAIRFYINYLGGQFCYELLYAFYEVPDDKVVYLVEDEIRNPHKTCGSVERIFHVPFHSLMEANKYLRYMEGKNRFLPNCSACEDTSSILMIVNGEKWNDPKDEFCLIQKHCLDIMMAHDLLWDQETLNPFPVIHQEILEKMYGDESLKSCEVHKTVCTMDEVLLNLKQDKKYCISDSAFVDELGTAYVKVYDDGKFIGWIERKYFL